MVDMPFEMLVDSDENDLNSDGNSIVSDTPKVEKLTKTLPASLMTLRIPGPIEDPEELADQLMDLLERKGESRPQMSKIAIGCASYVEESTRRALEDACKAVSVSLEEWEFKGAHPWPDGPA